MDDIYSGICRKIKGRNSIRPAVKNGDSCCDWQDAGPQYHIRMGWIKNQKKKE
jgi:hypothetical protein